MERAVEIYAIVNFTVIGISHLLRPRVWVDLFALLRDRGDAGIFAVGLLNLIFGSIVVSFHNVWSGIPLVLTLIGWANVLKALAYLSFPALPRRRLAMLSHARAYLVAIGGGFFLLVAALLGYHVWATA